MTLREINDIEAIIRSYHPRMIAKFNAILDAELAGETVKAESLKSLLTPGERTYYVVYMANNDRVIPFQESVLEETATPILYNRQAQISQSQGNGQDEPANNLSSSYERRKTEQTQYFDIGEEEPASDASSSSKKDCRLM